MTQATILDGNLNITTANYQRYSIEEHEREIIIPL